MPTAQADTAGTLIGVPVIAVLANDAGGGPRDRRLHPADHRQLALEAGPELHLQPTPASWAAMASPTPCGTVGRTDRDRPGHDHGEPPNRPPWPPTTPARVTAGSVVLPVLANDNDPDGDPLGIS